MRRRIILAACLPWLAAAPCPGGAEAAAPGTNSAARAAALWTARVQPVLDVNCVKCHGPLQQKGGLELDNLAMLLKGGEDGPVVVPGHPQQSRLVKALAADADPHMPPKKQLTEAEQAGLRDWVAALPVEALAATNAVNLTAPGGPAAAPVIPREFADPTVAIDTLLAEDWRARKVTPAAPAPDRVWCRRVYLDLAGRTPTATELLEFLTAPEAGRRAELVDRLLHGPEYPVRLRELWDFFLLGRPKRENGNDQRQEKGWWPFLEQAFQANRPWNEIVRDFLVARPTSSADRGAAWFVYSRRNDHQAIAEAVAPVVYGTRIDCAQCHDHPLAREIKQAHYWGLVAAYNRSKNVEGETGVAESAIGGFVNFTNLKKESQPAIVALLTGRTVAETRPAAEQKEEDADDKYLDPKAKVKVPKFSRRAAFADAATKDNPLLARAFVNRTWAAFLGRGIVQPPDQMNARNAPSQPELLAWLAADFAAHNHDIRRLVRALVLSRAYGLSPGGGPPEAFAGALERPLTAEQLARSWRVAAGLTPGDDGLQKAAVIAVPLVPPADYNANYQQAQFLARSPLLGALLNPAPGGLVARLAALPQPADRVREAFLAVDQRSPDAEEAARAAALLQAGEADPAAAVRDLLWALLTSAEFLTMP